MKNDFDPLGWRNYAEIVESPDSHFCQFIYNTCSANPDSAELQVKSLNSFITANKGEYAIEAAHNIAKHHVKHAKTNKALKSFNAFLKQADLTKLPASASEKLKELQEKLLPEFEKKKVTQADAASGMEYAHEMLKENPKEKSLQKLVLESLNKDQKAHTKVYLAEKMHKRLIKIGADTSAK